jgi:transposase-like protein
MLNRSHKHKHLTEEQKAIIIQMHITNGHSKVEIAKKLGISPNTVHLWVKRYQNNNVEQRRPYRLPEERDSAIEQNVIRITISRCFSCALRLLILIIIIVVLVGVGIALGWCTT